MLDSFKAAFQRLASQLLDILILCQTRETDVNSFSTVTRELPNNVPYAAKLSFIKDFQVNWPAVARDTVDQVYATVRRIAGDLVKEQFAQYQHLEPRLRYVIGHSFTAC